MGNSRREQESPPVLAGFDLGHKINTGICKFLFSSGLFLSIFMSFLTTESPKENFSVFQLPRLIAKGKRVRRQRVTIQLEDHFVATSYRPLEKSTATSTVL